MAQGIIFFLIIYCKFILCNISLVDLHGPFWPTLHSQLQPAEQHLVSKI